MVSRTFGNRACVVKRVKFVACSAFHGEELGLILLRHRIKNIRIWGPHDPGLKAYSKHTFPLWKADSKSCGFICKIHRTRGNSLQKYYASPFFTLSRHTSCTCVLYFYFRTSCTCHASSSSKLCIIGALTAKRRSLTLTQTRCSSQFRQLHRTLLLSVLQRVLERLSYPRVVEYYYYLLHHSTENGKNLILQRGPHGSCTSNL